MRNTIRRGLFVTATTAVALVGLGLGQGSAAPVPPAPALPLGGLTSLGQNGLSGLPGLGTLQDLPGQAGGQSVPFPGDERALPTDGLGLGSLTEGLGLGSLTEGLGGLGGLTNGLGDLGGLTQGLGLGGLTNGVGARDGLGDVAGDADLAAVTELIGAADPAGLKQLNELLGLTEAVAQAEGVLPTRELGLPIEPSMVLSQLEPTELSDTSHTAQLLTQARDFAEAPVLDAPSTEDLPLAGQIDQSNVTGDLLPSDTVAALAVPRVATPDVTAIPQALDLPATTPLTKGAEKLGLPADTSTVSDLVTRTLGLDKLAMAGQVSGLPAVPAV